MKREGEGEKGWKQSDKDGIHSVIRKDLGHVSKKEAVMVIIQHIVLELRK